MKAPQERWLAVTGDARIVASLMERSTTSGCGSTQGAQAACFLAEHGDDRDIRSLRSYSSITRTELPAANHISYQDI